ncbi:redoxin domain-containing protein [Haloferula chungangensis]|uniref:Redoxin domain-containing protein n=1 Tax=Haloferula chungangensis TaxID=1048331 RepID=A0ABW2LC50_9BACT
MHRLFTLLFITTLAAEPLDPGHSHQGEAFNEGPRQEAVIIEGTGKVHLPITTSWEDGQAYFDQGLGQLHGFWYYEAERSFRQIAAHDPHCAMAYWGMAMANWENPERARDFIDKASSLATKASPRELQYINAQANYYDGIPEDAKARNLELVHDLEGIIHDYPHDLEAKAFLACRLWQFSEKGGIPIPSHEAVDALLQQIFSTAPLHPAHHYRIHLWDKHKAERAIDSAAKLGITAPAIAHMWHMPGHIYSKLSRHEDAVWHQMASSRIDHAHMHDRQLLPDQIHNYAHNNEWLARSWIHLGNAPEALAMAKSLLANPRHPKLNSLEGKAHSYRYGRDRLLEVLEKFELWNETLMLAGTTWLEALPESRDELPRLRLIGIAQSELKQKDYLMETIAKVEAIKKTKGQEPQKARNNGNRKAGGKANKEAEQINKTLDELKACLSAIDGDTNAALTALERSQRPDFAKALKHLALGNEKKADELSKATMEKSRNQTLPLAARIEVLHALERHDEARRCFGELRQHSSHLDLQAPPFVRLLPIAKEYGIPDDWTVPYEIPADFGERPNLTDLGPRHWSPPQAYNFALASLYLQSNQLSDYRGQAVILIHYLGHSCLHCAEQLNAIAERYDDFKKSGLTVIAISTDDYTELSKSQYNYASSDGPFPFPLCADPDMKSFRAYNAYDDFEKQPLHGTHLISPKGRVLWSDISADPFMDIDFLLNESSRLLKLHHSK